MLSFKHDIVNYRVEISLNQHKMFIKQRFHGIISLNNHFWSLS
jgi:hypothetical protein